ncbi:MAG: hypothetical protein JW940_16710 [Polyangiaceae bacterium]|nr:hypothetical protein [Polyangiaceae bacterium]
MAIEQEPQCSKFKASPSRQCRATDVGHDLPDRHGEQLSDEAQHPALAASLIPAVDRPTGKPQVVNDMDEVEHDLEPATALASLIV